MKTTFSRALTYELVTPIVDGLPTLPRHRHRLLAFSGHPACPVRNVVK